jgi:hypothetical protein
LAAFGGAITSALPVTRRVTRFVVQGFSIPNDIEPGHHDQIVTIPGDMPA